MARKTNYDEEEELEEFDEDSEEDDEEPTLPKLPEPILPRLNNKKPAARFREEQEEAQKEEQKEAEEHFRNAVKQQEKEKAEPKPEIQYLPVPRVVPIETMLNEIYDRQEQILNILQEIKNERK